MEDNTKALAEQTAHQLGDVVILRSLAHGYHWNVMGVEFSQYHDFFEEIYEDIDQSVDPLAENILKLGYDSPYLLGDFVDLSCIDEPRIVGSNGVASMLESLQRANKKTIDCYYTLIEMAERCNEQGLVDFVGGRIDMHNKWDWQLKASMGIR